MKKIVFAAVFLTIPSTAFAHAHWTSPVPRNDIDNIKDGNDLAPCGGDRGTPHIYAPGETITVEWTETVDHPGYYQMMWSTAGDANFVMMENNIPNPEGKQDQAGDNTFQFTFPNEECTDCTLQLVQVMEDRNPPTNYYSCIDFTLQVGGAPDMGSDAGEEVGVPDAGAPDAGAPDVGAPEMGSANNAPGNNSPPNNSPGNNLPGNTNTGGPTNGTNGGTSINGQGGCSTVSTSKSVALLPLLFLFGLLGFRRRG